MDKDGQTFCLDLFISLLHKLGSCSTLYFLCCYANYPSRMKTNGSVYNALIISFPGGGPPGHPRDTQGASRGLVNFG